MKTTRCLVLGFLLCSWPLCAMAENWGQWRGPFFNGSTTESNLPSTWSKTENVLWVTPLPGSSHATPVVWDDSVFVSSPDEDKNLLLLCLDRKTGKIRWQKQLGVGDRTQGRNNMASPSPVTDGKTVWAMTGTGELAAFDYSGNVLWTRHLAKDYGKFAILWLYGSSPMLYKNHLYIEVLQRNPVPGGYSTARDGNPSRDSFLLCLDPATGKNIWKHNRVTDAVGESMEAYSTPMPEDCGNKTEIIVVGGDYVTGHDAANGNELWRGGGLRNFNHLGDSRLVPSPLLADGLAIVCGAKRNPVLAFNACGSGDVTKAGLAWSNPECTSDCVTPLFYEGNVYEFDGDRQTLFCLEPKTGSVKWKKRLETREIFRASPSGADGKIYLLSENATAVVLSAADGKVLSTINMDEGQTHATISAAQGCLFVRTAQNLYCIGKK